MMQTVIFVGGPWDGKTDQLTETTILSGTLYAEDKTRPEPFIYHFHAFRREDMGDDPPVIAAPAGVPLLQAMRQCIDAYPDAATERNRREVFKAAGVEDWPFSESR